MPISFYAHSIQVREIWIGNLPGSINQNSLRNFLQRYGPIDNIDYFVKL